MTRNTTMRKMLVLAVAAAALALAACCPGLDGDVYLSFNWTYTPEWFATDDPHLPDIIYRNAQYLTEAGSWYFEYYHDESGYIRWIRYTLEAHEGFLFGVQAEDAVFELFLSAFSSPDLIQWQSVTGEPADQPEEIRATGAPTHAAELLAPDFEQTMTSGRWILKVQLGAIEP
jgi:hypothetical protein